jgi:hypothetical protein
MILQPNLRTSKTTIKLMSEFKKCNIRRRMLILALFQLGS